MQRERYETEILKRLQPGLVTKIYLCEQKLEYSFDIRDMVPLAGYKYLMIRFSRACQSGLRVESQKITAYTVLHYELKR